MAKRSKRLLTPLSAKTYTVKPREAGRKLADRTSPHLQTEGKACNVFEKHAGKSSARVTIKREKICPAQVVWIDGKPHVRFCSYPLFKRGLPGYSIPIKNNDALEAQRVALAACECWHKEGKKDWRKCLHKLPGAQLKGVRGARKTGTRKRGKHA